MKKIRFGLTAIKGFGEEPSAIILAEREKNGPFENLYDFVTRLPAKLMNKKTLEALAFSGALDCFGNRGDIVASIEDIIKLAKENEAEKTSGQIDLFGGMEEEIGGDIEFKLRCQPATKEDILRWEKESLGLFVSDHPLKGLDAYFQKYGTPIGQLIQEHNAKIEAAEQVENGEGLDNLDGNLEGDGVMEKGGKNKGKKEKKRKDEGDMILHGIVTTMRKIITKAGKNMAIFELEDTSGKMECVVFPAAYEKNPEISQLVEDAFVKVLGKVKEKDGNLNCLVNKVVIGNLKDVQERGHEIEFSGESAGKNGGNTESISGDSERFVVEIPGGTMKSQVDEIKKLLIGAKSDEGVGVLVRIDGKEIELPFLIEPSEEISGQISRLLGEITF